jgi:hypothetical protein
MERLLVVKLDAVDCEAEVRLNGIPLARVAAARPRAIVPAHEFTMAGNNRLELIIWPRPATTPDKPALPPEPRVSDGRRSAHVRILLPRIGSPADEGTARTLAQLDWAPPEREAYQAPVLLSQDITLPVSFPRWRWMDAPVSELTPAMHASALAFIQAVATDLMAGDVDRFVAATRLRTEELALAYQRRPEDETARWRAHLLALHAAKAFKFKELTAEGLVLRPLAGSRLYECLDPEGQPALRTEADAQGTRHGLPLRVTLVEGKVYVLR